MPPDIQVEHVSGVERRRLEGIIRRHDAQIGEMLLEPELIEWLSPEQFRCDKGLIVASEGVKIKGLLCYQLLFPKSFRELYAILPCKDADSLMAAGFRDLKFREAVAYISEMESFKRRAGIARALVGSLRQLPGIDAILIDPNLDENIPVYRRLGFRESGLCNPDTGMPIMISVNR